MAEPAVADQEQVLDSKCECVRRYAFFMKRGRDNNDLRDALKNASSMVNELRTSELHPANYYELYNLVTDELRHLEGYFEDEYRRYLDGNGRSMVELYETVQHAGNIIPRLYLLITVASVYIQTKEVPAKEILFDLVELARGVQHPMRGLFLRYYLLQKCKDKLPDVGSPYEGQGGDVRDSIEFILQNFGEMNKLWVRMQHQGAVRDRGRREKERQNLKMLVGTNLVRLSQLEGVDSRLYQELVLPRVLEQIVNCKDAIAQEYLMDCIIMVFSDEFHLATLESFLTACGQLQPNVNVNQIIISLMNRLSRFAKESPDQIPDNLDMFPLFQRHVTQLIQSRERMSLEDVLSLQVALINFATKVYPDRLEHIDLVLRSTVDAVGSRSIEARENGLITKLLTTPLETMALSILELEHYPTLMRLLNFDSRKSIAVEILKAELKCRERLTSVERVEKFFDYIRPLVVDEPESAAAVEADKLTFESEQYLVARFVHLLHNVDTDEHYKLLATARKHFGLGGASRIVYTLVPLVFSSLSLARRAFDREAKGEELQFSSRKVLQFVHKTITALSGSVFETCFRLFLQAAQVADYCRYEAIVYEFLVQAMLIYEEKFENSSAQYRAISLLISTLQQLKCLGSENYDTVSVKATQFSARLLKQSDSSHCVGLCAHLFWNTVATEAGPAARDPQKVLGCLQRGLKTASAILDVVPKVDLFLVFLNKYMYFFENGCQSVTDGFISDLIALVVQHLHSLDKSEESQRVWSHYMNTVNHIRLRQRSEEDGARYQPIVIPDIQ
eukprot:TRINITY_DN2889_c0_g2_i1.p1 TRINITY_DN2889_c0_g2~~TRINITY_DN2889_c0_g2_i1.p1  ORF type:complete len:816 (-),score=323.42 TRINITY_DN2889_c0_g2_i1:316-2682(-)